MQYDPKSPTYLLRFDDICPTMNWRIWTEIESALAELKLKPILAVVPDNQDAALQVDAPRQDFWERVRNWQSNGWTIGLHGYQHRYVSAHRGIVATRKKSEFAGIPAQQQEEKLRRAVDLMNQHGVEPQLWIAPGNSFDAATVSLLPRFGISTICDGNFRFPFVCAEGLLWIPQQLFRFRPAPAGVWTVCYHHNSWSPEHLHAFREHLEHYSTLISTFEQVAQSWSGRRSWWSAFCCTSPRFSDLLIRCQLKLVSCYKSMPDSSHPAMKDLSALQPR